MVRCFTSCYFVWSTNICQGTVIFPSLTCSQEWLMHYLEQSHPLLAFIWLSSPSLYILCLVHLVTILWVSSILHFYQVYIKSLHSCLWDGLNNWPTDQPKDIHHAGNSRNPSQSRNRSMTNQHTPIQSSIMD